MNVVDQDGPPKKKQRQTRCETQPEEKKLLEPLVTCSEYPTSDQINQVIEALGNEWDKNRIYQYISRHRRKKIIAMNKINYFILNKFIF